MLKNKHTASIVIIQRFSLFVNRNHKKIWYFLWFLFKTWLFCVDFTKKEQAKEDRLKQADPPGIPY